MQKRIHTKTHAAKTNKRDLKIIFNYINNSRWSINYPHIIASYCDYSALSIMCLKTVVDILLKYDTSVLS